MRQFEMVQLVVVALAVYLPVLTGFRLKRGWMAVLLVGAMVTQLVMEGFRYQLLPLEFASLGLAAGDVLWDERRVRGWPRVRRALLGVPGLALVAVLPAVLPVPELPRPSGPFTVGTQTFYLVDRDRQEQYGMPVESDNEGADSDIVTVPRRIVVQAWYPANLPSDPEPVPWNPDSDVVGPALSRRIGFPGFFLSHTRNVLSHSYQGARPLSGRFPVVIYSHGWTGFRTIALNQMEELASRGYLVLAPDHTYGAVATRFPDGRVIHFDPAALPDEEEVGSDRYLAAVTELIATFADDIVFMIDQLDAGDEGGFGSLSEHADTDLLGIYGHSTGGGAAVRACLLDERCGAVLGLDAWVEPIPNRVIANELDMPSMFIRSDGWRDTPNDRRLRGLAERSPAESWWMAIEGAGHNDFVITPFFSPVADRLGLKGPIDSEKVTQIIDGYLTGFFDRYLYQVGGAILRQPPPTEVGLERIP